MLLDLDPAAASQRDAKVLEDFRYLTAGPPQPGQISGAMWKSQSKGYASMIQPEYITRCTCAVRGTVAEGTVSFRAEGLYQGTVQYVARVADGG